MEPAETSKSLPEAEFDSFISVDVESAGPNPSRYSMLAIGACSVRFPERNFYLELKPVNALFQSESLESCGLSMEKLAREGVDPAEAMKRFAAWLKETVPPEMLPVFVGFNAPFDWMFVNDYFHRFLGYNPFGHAALDIKSFYMGMARVPWSETTMQFLGNRYLSQPALVHHALRDALDQGEIFRKLLLEAAEQQHGSPRTAAERNPE